MNVSISTDVVANDGDTEVKIKCQSSNTSRRIQWYHDGANISVKWMEKEKTCLNESGSYHLGSNTDILLLCNIAYSHAGIYTCVSGQMKRNITLTVEGKITFCRLHT